MKLNLTKTSSKEDSYKSLLVSGDPGAGKTTLVTTLPYSSEDKVLVVSADLGHLSLAHKSYQLVKGPFDEHTRAELIAYIEAEAKAKRLEWVVIDGLDEIGKTILEAEMAAEMKEAKPDSWAAFRRLGSRARAFIRRIQQIPVNSLFITHQYVDKDNPIKFWPDFPGVSLYSEIPALFDSVFALYFRQKTENGKVINERILQTRRDEGGNTLYQTKVRDPFRKVAAFEPPHLGEILKKMVDTAPEA